MTREIINISPVEAESGVEASCWVWVNCHGEELAAGWLCWRWGGKLEFRDKTWALGVKSGQSWLWWGQHPRGFLGPSGNASESEFWTQAFKFSFKSCRNQTLPYNQVAHGKSSFCPYLGPMLQGWLFGTIWEASAPPNQLFHVQVITRKSAEISHGGWEATFKSQAALKNHKGKIKVFRVINI